MFQRLTLFIATIVSIYLCGSANAEATSAFYDRVRELESGDQVRCAYPVGTFQSPEGSHSIQIKRIPESLYLERNFERLGIVQAYVVDANGIQTRTPVVLARLQDHSWKWIPLDQGYKSDREELIVLDRFFKNATLEHVRLSPDAHLSDDSTELRIPSDFRPYRWNGVLSFLKFYSGKKTKLANAADFLDQHQVRVPREFYEILRDPSFKNARSLRNYSAVLDLIYLKSKSLVGDSTLALTLSLIVTDLRERGPCGSVFGLRGREIVPLSLFDQEEPSYLEPSRLDGPQHFFGYAIFSQLTHFSGVISKASKERDYYFPEAKFLFQQTHVGAAKSSSLLTFESELPRLSTLDFRRPKRRRRVDVDRDLLYNDLGMEFGSRLLRDPQSLPSEVLKDPQFSEQRRNCGIGPARANKPWRAFDPSAEPLYVLNHPNEQAYQAALLEYEQGKFQSFLDVQKVVQNYSRLRDPVSGNPLQILSRLCIFGPNGGAEKYKTDEFCRLYEQITQRVAEHERMLYSY